jgi:predicted RNA-binding protein
MKMTSILRWSAGVLSAFCVTAAAAQPAASPVKDKEFRGRVDSVNIEEHTVTVMGLFRHRTFDLGNDCSITRWDNTAGAINDLRPGEKVTVGYQDTHGVFAADRVVQEPIRFQGVVKSMDPGQRQLVLRRWDHDRAFALAEDCKVILHDQKSGALASIRPGDHISVVYETPSGQNVVRQIAQTSMNFTGSVVAIDLAHRTLTLEDTLGTRQFSLANDCSIVMENTIDAPMMDLRPGQRLTIDYDEINGVNVANRIAPTSSAPPATTAQVNP